MSFVHPTATVEDGVHLGSAVQIWAGVQLRTGSRIGNGTIVGKDSFVDAGVVIGANCKIQNACQIYRECRIEDGVFLGPGVIVANDKWPRAVSPDGRQKGPDDWVVGSTTIRSGASVGAGAIVLPDVEIGPWALIGAGAVVTRDVDAHTLVVGSPGRPAGSVCRCGFPVTEPCEQCGWGP